MQTVANENTEQTNNTETSKRKTFESAKSKIEFISVLLALVAVVGTGLLKIISYGQVVHFAFDLEYYDFALNQKDLIALVSLLCSGGVALLYCVLTDSIRKNITSFIMHKLPQIVSHIIAILANVVWFALLPLAGIVICCVLATECSVIKIALNELPYFIVFAIIVMAVVVLFWAALENHAAAYYVTSFIVLLSVTICMTEQQYNEATTKKEYDIIVCNERNDEEYYAVISRGDKFSAYKCDIIPSEEGNKLIVYTKMHRFFAIDSVSTISVCFEKYDDEAKEYIPNVNFEIYDNDTLIEL